MPKLKTKIECDWCGRELIRPINSSWKDITKLNGWKWCCASGETKAKLLCGNCTVYFETKYNIDPLTGISKC